MDGPCTTAVQDRNRSLHFYYMNKIGQVQDNVYTILCVRSKKAEIRDQSG